MIFRLPSTAIPEVSHLLWAPLHHTLVPVCTRTPREDWITAVVSNRCEGRYLRDSMLWMSPPHQQPSPGPSLEKPTMRVPMMQPSVQDPLFSLRNVCTMLKVIRMRGKKKRFSTKDCGLHRIVQLRFRCVKVQVHLLGASVLNLGRGLVQARSNMKPNFYGAHTHTHTHSFLLDIALPDLTCLYPRRKQHKTRTECLDLSYTQGRCFLSTYSVSRVC